MRIYRFSVMSAALVVLTTQGSLATDITTAWVRELSHYNRRRRVTCIAGFANFRDTAETPP
jgi:hypothetical protein